MKIKILLGIAFIFAFCHLTVVSQENLIPNTVKKFKLKPEETKSFNLNLKKDDFAEISWTSVNDSLSFKYKIISPSGVNLPDLSVALENSFGFVAPEDGIYRAEITPQTYEGQTVGVSDFSVQYKNKFVLPRNSKIKASRKINGYDAKIYEVGGESDDAYLVIEKAGRMKYIAKATKNVGGLYFPDELEIGVSKPESDSATLLRTIADKTGDGTPDLAVQYYSGGAHCCFSMFFYELGNEVKPIKALNMGDADVAAIGKSPNGGLKLSSGDATFAYWNTSFAGSPIPEIVLDFRDGEFRANAKLMQKPVPPLAELKKEAAEINRKMPLGEYKNNADAEAVADFDEAFWGRMLDLIYSGHEDLAWQYFDWAWNPKKKGKEAFKKDFEKKLASSEFYQMFLTSK